MKNRVSIIITHYNNARYLEQAVYSVLVQSYKPFEIIVVDDCSLPDQRAEAQRICHKAGAKFIQRDKNGGHSKARNDGIRMSRGEWIQMLDGDDFLTPDSLRSRMSALPLNKDALWVAGQYSYVKSFVSPKHLNTTALKILPWFKLRAVPVIEPGKVKAGDPWVVKWPHWTMLFHRSLFEIYGLYDEEIRMGGDKELRWRFWYFSETIPIKVNHIVYAYRRDVAGQLTHKSNDEARRLNCVVMMRNIEKRKIEGLTRGNTIFLV